MAATARAAAAAALLASARSSSTPRLCLRALGSSSTAPSSSTPLYPTHTPLSPFQRAALAVGDSLGAAADPRRADLVAAAGEATGGPAFAAAVRRMRASPSGRVILEKRPRVTVREREKERTPGNAATLSPLFSILKTPIHLFH